MSQMLTPEKYQKLTKQICDDTGYSSNISDAIRHPACQEIISHGKEALLLLLETLATDPHWHCFEALRQITGENPVKYEHRGRINEMSEDWLDWARKNHHPKP